MRIHSFKKALLAIMIAMVVFACSRIDETEKIVHSPEINVDGYISDWKNIPAIVVDEREHLWYGERLPKGVWKEEDDL